jgi:hypothetical protein
MPLTLMPISHGTLCHGSRWTVADEDDLAGKVARLALGQARHVAAILTGIDKRPPATRADTAAGAIKLLTVPKDKPPYHRDGWVFQAMSWIAAHRAEAGAVIRAPHMIHAHKGFDGFQLKLDGSGQNITAVVIFEDKATENPRSTITGDVWDGIRDLENGLRMNELIPEAGSLLEAHQQRFPDLDIDSAIERIAWEEARYFRVAVTAGAAHDNDDARAALFKGFDEVAPGLAARRQAETIAIPKLRDWMKAFSLKAIKQIEAWRDNV